MFVKEKATHALQLLQIFQDMQKDGQLPASMQRIFTPDGKTSDEFKVSMAFYVDQNRKLPKVGDNIDKAAVMTGLEGEMREMWHGHSSPDMLSTTGRKVYRGLVLADAAGRLDDYTVNSIAEYVSKEKRELPMELAVAAIREMDHDAWRGGGMIQE